MSEIILFYPTKVAIFTSAKKKTKQFVKQNTKIMKIRRKRSEKLTSAEWKKYKDWVANHDTKVDAAEDLGRSTITIDAVLLKGSGSPETIAIIREKIFSV